MLKLIVCLLLASGALCQGRPAFLRDVSCNPWGQLSLIVSEIDAAWGAGNYDTYDFSAPVGTILAAEAIYMEGSFLCTTELKSWHDANTAAIAAYVQNGGRIFVNIATNELSNWCFSAVGVCINGGGSGSCVASAPFAPFFLGPLPTTTSLTGGSCSHDFFTGGGDVLMTGSSGPIVVTQTMGKGSILFASFTTSNFWAPNPQARNLFSNILTYLYAGIPHSITVSVNPSPGSVGSPVTVSFSYTGNSAALARVDYDEDSSADDSLNVPSAGTYSFAPYTYGTTGLKTITVCVDDGVGTDSCTSIAAKKRLGSNNSGTVTINVAGGGDPYFLGLDGVIFKFEGRNNHWYNLISSSLFQLNTLLDRGQSENPQYQMKQLMRSASIQTPDYKLRFDVGTFGQVNCTIQQGAGNQLEFPKERAMSVQLGDSHLDWNFNQNSTRVSLHMSPHLVHQRLEITTSQLKLTIMAVELMLRGDKYHFLDMEFNQIRLVSSHDPALDCWEGVWGRTSCRSSLETFDLESYDLGVNGYFNNDFPMNLYVS